MTSVRGRGRGGNTNGGGGGARGGGPDNTRSVVLIVYQVPRADLGCRRGSWRGGPPGSNGAGSYGNAARGGASSGNTTPTGGRSSINDQWVQSPYYSSIADRVSSMNVIGKVTDEKPRTPKGTQFAIHFTMLLLLNILKVLRPIPRFPGQPTTDPQLKNES
jgi:hypothetical protein